MTEEIVEFEEELKEVIEEIKQILHVKIPKLNGNALAEKCEYVKTRLNRARQLIRSFNVELRTIPFGQKNEFQAKATEFEKIVNGLTKESNEASSKALLAGTEKKMELENMTAKQMTDKAMEVQKDSLDSTARAKKIVQNTIAIGNDTVGKLQNQTEKMQNVDEHMELLESNVARAEKELRTLIRFVSVDF